MTQKFLEHEAFGFLPRGMKRILPDVGDLGAAVTDKTPRPAWRLVGTGPRGPGTGGWRNVVGETSHRHGLTAKVCLLHQRNGLTAESSTKSQGHH